jgi:hypothetical protein
MPRKEPSSDASNRLGVELDFPVVLEQGAHCGIGDVAIAR